MRKVTTASAVILTALTGCSPSSSVPSTQWSFKVPSIGEASTQPTDASKESSATPEHSNKNQLFANAAGSSRMMGPAFEQPNETTPLGAQVSTVGRPGSKEISNLARTYDLAESAGTIETSTRPDPVAQVRAYLRANSPSELIDRTPYNSQVYLSAAPQPTYPSSYAPSANIAETFPNSSLSAASPDYLAMPQSTIQSETASAEISGAGASLSSEIANSSNYAVLSVSEALPDSNGSSYVATGSESYSSGSYSSEAYSSTNYSSTSSTVDADGLPQLDPNTASTYTAPPASAGLAQAIQPEATETQADSIGTTILQNLQRSEAAGTSAATSPDPSPYTEADSIGTTILQNLQRSTTSEISPDANSVSEAVTSDSMTAIASAAPTRSQSLVAVAPSPVESRQAAAYSEPVTLDRLSETMPEREASPLVTTFRADNGSAEQALLLKNLQSLAQDEALDSTGAVESTIESTVETDLQSSESAPSFISPLLEGLQGELSTQSVIYVPIAEASPVNSSQALISLEATSLLTPDVSTSAFVEGLAQSNVFASVLSSPNLIASLHTPNLDTSERFSPAELTLQRSSKVRQAKISLAAQQASKLRQRLAWL